MQELTDAGVPVGPATTVDGPAELLTQLAAGHRLLWDATSLTYPALVGAGIRVERCHDITLTERILLGRQGVFGAPCSARAVHARATGTPVPDDPVRTDADAEPTLFEPGATGDKRVEALAVDPIEVLRVALVDQLRRIADDRALGLLIAAESASALAAVEMGSTGLPWRAEVHLGLLATMLGPQAASRRAAAALGAAGGGDQRRVRLSGQSGFGRRSARRVPAGRVRHRHHPVLGDQGSRTPGGRSGADVQGTRPLHTANGWNWHDEWAAGRPVPTRVPARAVSSPAGGPPGVAERCRSRARSAPRWSPIPGHRLVVADAAQLEPRVLAAISRDTALQAVSADADLYTALADDGFGGDRAHAKLAMLGAMYGATSGEAGRLLGTLRRRYPAAMQCVQDAAHRGRTGRGGALGARPGLPTAERRLAGGRRMGIAPGRDGPGTQARPTCSRATGDGSPGTSSSRPRRPTGRPSGCPGLRRD